MSSTPQCSIAVSTGSASAQENSAPPTILILCSTGIGLFRLASLSSRFRGERLTSYGEMSGRHLAQDDADGFAWRTDRCDGGVGECTDQPLLVVRRAPFEHTDFDDGHLNLHLKHNCADPLNGRTNGLPRREVGCSSDTACHDNVPSGNIFSGCGNKSGSCN